MPLAITVARCKSHRMDQWTTVRGWKSCVSKFGWWNSKRGANGFAV